MVKPGGVEDTRTVEAAVDCPVFDSPRVRQIAAMFDMQPADRARETFAARFPPLARDWRIGLVVGPSATGKTTLAREAFGGHVYAPQAWPADRAVIDCLHQVPALRAVELFTAVGFGSPPAWLKPYRALSGGERFRCDLARALAGTAPDDVLVFDEFTSLVDRRSARTAAAALARAIRTGQVNCRFVGITCHPDITRWLAPDWVVDTATGSCDWGRLQRPPIRLGLYRCRQNAWRLFARHHYLNKGLNRGSRAWLAAWGRQPVAFCATLPLAGRRLRWRITRLVTLPDYQGLGIGMKLAEAVARMHRQAGLRVSVTASHPSVLAHCRRSRDWRLVAAMRQGSRASGFKRGYCGSTGRAVVSFEYLGSG